MSSIKVDEARKIILEKMINAFFTIPDIMIFR